MKITDLLAVGIRLLGIFVLLLALRTWLTNYLMFSHFLGQGENFYFGYFVVNFLLPLLLLVGALIMLKFPHMLARWFLPPLETDQLTLSGSFTDLQNVLITVIGVYILSWAIPDLINNAMEWWYYRQNSSLPSSNTYFVAQVVTVIEIAIGLVLCLRARGLTGALHYLRSAGQR